MDCFSASHFKLETEIDDIYLMLEWLENGAVTDVQFTSVQNDIHALGKTHTRSTPSLRRLNNFAFETVPTFV